MKKISFALLVLFCLMNISVNAFANETFNAQEFCQKSAEDEGIKDADKATYIEECVKSETALEEVPASEEVPAN